jgi:hypothetical protein
VGSTSDRDHVVHAHHRVGDDDRLDRSGQRATSLYIAVLILVFRQDQLDPDPEQQQSANDLEVGNGKQLEGEIDQNDAQTNGTEDAPEDSFVALCVGQFAARQGNHHGVVSPEQDVNGYDLEDRNPESRRSEIGHEAYPVLRARPPDSGLLCESVTPSSRPGNDRTWRQ